MYLPTNRFRIANRIRVGWGGGVELQEKIEIGEKNGSLTMEGRMADGCV